jgi:hypothetical protein
MRYSLPMPNATTARSHNGQLFDSAVDRTARSASDIRTICRELKINVKDLGPADIDRIVAYVGEACTSCGNNRRIHNLPHAPSALCPTGYTSKESHMSDQTVATPADQPARKRTGSTTRSTDRAAKASTGLTAAEVARDNSLDARKFRAFLRSTDTPRTFARKADATKAVKQYQKSIS